MVSQNFGPTDCNSPSNPQAICDAFGEAIEILEDAPGPLRRDSTEIHTVKRLVREQPRAVGERFIDDGETELRTLLHQVRVRVCVRYPIIEYVCGVSYVLCPMSYELPLSYVRSR
jgi:hypothetical protein